MITVVARRATPSPAPEPMPTSPSTIDLRHVALDDATKRWLSEGDTPDNVAAYASALRDLLRASTS
jgi:hypothetical protein